MSIPTLELCLAGALAAILLWTAWTDWQSRTIDHWPVITIALAAPVFWWVTGTNLWPGVAIHIGVALLVFALFAGMFAIGAMGGGDVKLVAALVLWFTPGEVLNTILIMSILGGGLTLVMMLIHRWRKSPHKLEIPYGLAISCAGLWGLSERYLNHFG